jgi:hypothetical protein
MGTPVRRKRTIFLKVKKKYIYNIKRNVETPQRQAAQGEDDDDEEAGWWRQHGRPAVTQQHFPRFKPAPGLSFW